MSVSVVRDRLRLVSHFPGRLRVRAETFRVLPEVADEVAKQIAEEPGVREVKTSSVTGSMLVTYEPRELQLPRLVQLLVSAGGLRGIEVDAAADWSKAPAQGTRVREVMGALNDALKDASRGKVDMRVAVPGALVAGGVALLLAGRRLMPAWYDMFFWAFVTFSNLNPRSGDDAHADDAGART
jgi:hypothetical protein